MGDEETVVEQVVETVSDEETPAAEPEELEETTEGAEETPKAEDEGKGDHHKPANERIRELVEAKKEEARKREQIEAKLSEVETKLQQFEAQTVQSQFSQPLEMEAVNQRLREYKDAILDKEAEGNEWAAEQLREQLDQFRRDVKTYNEKHEEFKREKVSKEQQGKTVDGKLKTLETAAYLFRDTMKIPEKTFEDISDFFAAKCKEDPLLGREFAETMEYQGPTKAVKFAYDYAVKNMGKGAEADRVNKEQGKQGLVNVSGGGSAAPVKNYTELMRKGSKAVLEFKKNNPKAYQRLLDKHLE